MNVLRVVPRQLHSRSGGLFGFRPAELCSFQASDFLAKSEWDEMCLLIAQESWLEEKKVQDRKDEEEKKQVEWSTRGEPKSCNLSRTFGKTKQIPGQIILIVGPPLPHIVRLLLGRNTFIMRQVHNIRILEDSKHTQASR